jgi:hypothetical protein
VADCALAMQRNRVDRTPDEPDPDDMTLGEGQGQTREAIARASKRSKQPTITNN